MHSSASANSSRRRPSSGPNSADMSDRPWECCIPLKTLMPCPHFEAGCQDVFSIPATEVRKSILISEDFSVFLNLNMKS